MTLLAPAMPLGRLEDDGRWHLRVESLGGGLQSSGIAEMVVEGLITPPMDLVVFADTQGEMPATYAHVEYLRERLAQVNVPLIVATAGSLERDVHAAAGGTRSRMPSMPTRIRTPEGELERINNYHCSYDYKRRVVERAVREALGRGRWRNAVVEQWIGYSTDEGSRVKQPDGCRCGHKGMAHPAGGPCMTRLPTPTKGSGDRTKGPEPCDRGCEGFDPWQVNRFPLIELGMRRGDVAVWLREHGLPIPPRSACWFCPNRGNGHWRELRAGAPELWHRVIALDEVVRAPTHGIRGERFIHQSGVAIADADLRTAEQRRSEDEGQDTLWDDGEGAVAYDCDAGVCFT